MGETSTGDKPNPPHHPPCSFLRERPPRAKPPPCRNELPPSFDHRVGQRDHIWRNIEADRPGSLEVDDYSRSCADGRGARAAILYAFDLIEHDGEGIRNRPFLDRKAALARLLRNAEAGFCSVNT
jgi:hypothetical protein